MSYVPTGRRVMLYAPESLVSPRYGVPRAVSVAVTFAPLIGAPLGSATVPTIAAVTSWLHANCDVPARVSTTKSKQKNAIDGLLITEPSIPRWCMLYSRMQFIVKRKMPGRRSFLVEKH